MEKFVKGDIVVVPFPFSDLTLAKRRPALVIVSLSGDDMILCQITSKEIKDNYAIKLKENDFGKGSLHLESNIRPNKLFTMDRRIILYRAGHLKEEKIEEVIEKVVYIIRHNH